jgi:membrane protein YdbS with pleckstrin-like domain
LKIYIIVCLVAAGIFAYDGYLSRYQWSHRHSFYEKHVKQGQLDDTMVFNRIAPIFLVPAAVLLTVWFYALKDKKLLAGEDELIISDKKKISYNSIQKIDKTHFDLKGFFLITYKDKNGNEVNQKLSDKTYDNLAAILDHLVVKITKS